MTRRINGTQWARLGLLLFGLLLAGVAHGQDWIYPLPVQIERLKLENARLAARLKTADSTLRETRVNLRIAIDERDSRIQMLEDSCNSEVKRQADFGVDRDRAFTECWSTLDQVSRNLTSELLTTRFLGLGRKRALKFILRPLLTN